MRITSAAVLSAAFLGALLDSPRTGFAQESAAPLNHDNPPFVSLSLIGSDVVFSPDRVRFSVTADPGSYVTVFLISPSGHRSALNPYQPAITGSERRVLIREAAIGFETGESYLVAMATRSAFHSANLVRRAQSAGRLAGANIGAEASLNELLTAIMPIAGDDFSATYVSFRVISRGFGQPYSYAESCYGSADIPGSPFEDDGFYIRRPFDAARYDVLGDLEPLVYSLNPRYPATGCRDRFFDRAMIIPRAPTPQVPSIVRRDTSVVAVDSARTPGTPAVPRTHPVDPDAPGIPHPLIPTSLGLSPLKERVRPMSVPLRENPRSELPVTPVTPATPPTVERRDPVVPVIAPPMRVHPVDRVELERPRPTIEPIVRADPPMPSPVVSSPAVSASPPPSRIVDPSPATPAPTPPPA